jgi:hypothetical protein
MAIRLPCWIHPNGNTVFACIRSTPPEKRQDFGQRSKQSLSDLIFSKPVRVEVTTIDKYGREVGKVWIHGTDANLEQIKRGMAMVYRKYASDPVYFAAEERARSARIGLWSQPNPIPPWEFRHGGKRYSEGPASTTPEFHAHAGTSCGVKRYCGQMTSCVEARFYLDQCGVKSLDRDGDGEPCESLCR